MGNSTVCCTHSQLGDAGLNAADILADEQFRQVSSAIQGGRGNREQILRKGQKESTRGQMREELAGLIEQMYKGMKEEGEEGSLKNSKIVLPDGSIYHGQVADGLPHGFGMEIHANGDVYAGQFASGKKHGRGRYTFEGGAQYHGYFLNNQMHGLGEFRWPNGDLYEGTFSHNLMDGQGKYSLTDLSTYFLGTYANGLRHGSGELKVNHYLLNATWSNGAIQKVDSIRYLDPNQKPISSA